MSISHVLDDVVWSSVPLVGDALEEGLESLAGILRGINERRETVRANDDVYEVVRVGDASLFQMLFEARSLPQSLRVELQKRLDKITTLTSDEVIELEVTIDGQKHVAAAVAYAATRNIGGHPVAVITPAFSDRKGPVSVDCGGSHANVHFVSDERARLFFVRAVIVTLIDEDEFAALAPSAFPNVHFVDDVFDGLRMLSKSVRDISVELVKHLGVLSDHGRQIFDLRLNREIELGFQGHGVDISPENKETLEDGKCLRARTRSVDGVSLVFEWHTKIEGHQDRIHVHPGATVTGGCVSVGIIHKHLPLPGD